MAPHLKLESNNANAASAIHFYEKCLDNRLMEEDFSLAKDASTGQKLDILENMMSVKQNAAMIGDFTDRGSKYHNASDEVCTVCNVIFYPDN